MLQRFSDIFHTSLLYIRFTSGAFLLGFCSWNYFCFSTRGCSGFDKYDGWEFSYSILQIQWRGWDLTGNILSLWQGKDPSVIRAFTHNVMQDNRSLLMTLRKSPCVRINETLVSGTPGSLSSSFWSPGLGLITAIIRESLRATPRPAAIANGAQLRQLGQRGREIKWALIDGSLTS